MANSANHSSENPQLDQACFAYYWLCPIQSPQNDRSRHVYPIISHQIYLLIGGFNPKIMLVIGGLKIKISSKPPAWT